MRATDRSVYGNLFDLSSDAVTVLRNNKIIYLNSAAKFIFPEGNIQRYVPEFILEFEGERFSSTIEIFGENRAVSVAKVGADTVLTVYALTHSTDFKGLDNFLGSVSEELRSAMSVIAMSSELIRNEEINEKSGKKELYSAMLTHNAYIARRVMNNMDMIRVLNGKVWEKKTAGFDLVKLCRDILDSVNAVLDKGQMKIGMSSTENELIFTGDRDKIELVILNLLSNSLKYTDEDGKITVEVSKKGDGAVIKVADTGEGIRPERLVSSFESFISERDLCDPKAGSGVGLAIVDYIARMHNGFALLESLQNKGTTVTVLLRNDKNGALKDSGTEYGVNSMEKILIELSDILPHEAYLKKYLD